MELITKQVQWIYSAGDGLQAGSSIHKTYRKKSLLSPIVHEGSLIILNMISVGNFNLQ